MDVVLFIVGVFFLWKGQMQVSKKVIAWPKSKKTGRIIGAILLIPFIAGLIFVYINPPSSIQPPVKYDSLVPGAFYSNKQDGFKIIPPSGWIIAPSSFLSKNPDAGQKIQFLDRPNNIQAIVTVSQATVPGITASNIDSFFNDQVQTAKNTPNSLFIASDRAVSNGATYYLIEYKQKMSGGSGMSHVLQLMSLGKSGELFLVTGGSDDAIWLNFKDVIKSSLLSFSVI